MAANRIIRWTKAGLLVGVAAVAAAVSCEHAYALTRAQGDLLHQVPGVWSIEVVSPGSAPAGWGTAPLPGPAGPGSGLTLVFHVYRQAPWLPGRRGRPGRPYAGLLLITSQPPSMTSLKSPVTLAAGLSASLTWTVKSYVPSTVGTTPLMVPFDFSLTPAGSEPLISDQV